MTTLAELRLANLREQKKSADAASSPVPITEDAPAADTLNADTPKADHAALPEAGAPAPPAPHEPAPREEDLVLSQFLSEEVPAAPAADPETERSAALMARVQAMLAHKTLHPNGAKATVDMSPALFHRAKRYCLDHGNVTLRQLFLDLMTAFLDEEGY